MSGVRASPDGKPRTVKVQIKSLDGTRTSDKREWEVSRYVDDSDFEVTVIENVSAVALYSTDQTEKENLPQDGFAFENA